MNKVFLLFFLVFSSFISLHGQTAKDILIKSEDKQKGESSYMEIKMSIIRPTWKREIRMKSWAKGEDYSLILISAPARDKGLAYLKRKKEMWNWQPSIERVIKMPPSMMTQSWMGSDFTNDDLVQQSSVVDDYSHKLLGEENIDGRNCYKIELIPHEDAAVVWGKVLMWIDQKDYLKLKVEFYDEDNYLVNTMLGKNIKTIGGRTLPSILEIIPAEEKGHKTMMEYLNAEFNAAIPNQTFSIQNMKRVR